MGLLSGGGLFATGPMQPFAGPVGAYGPGQLMSAPAGAPPMAIGPVGAPPGQAAAPPPSAEEPPSAAPPPSESEPPAAAPHSTADREGPAQLVEEALASVCLDADQQAKVAALGKAVEGPLAAVDDARHALMTALAEQLEKDCFDRSAVEDQVAALAAAHAKASPVLRSALKALHEILTPDQRKQFADALGKAISERAEDFKAGAWLDRWTKDLSLTEKQKAQVRQAFRTLERSVAKAREGGKKLLEAFPAEHFDPDAIVPASEVPARAEARARSLVDLAEALHGILTPEQRAILAEKIEQKKGHRENEQSEQREMESEQ